PAVELMPVHFHARDRHLEEKGLTNYWGYNSFGYFAPERRLAASRTPAGAVREFKRMVRALHAAGLEVILDVVYNHTAEGNQMGPTLSLKGIDNVSYYRLVADDMRYYTDFTGCGNTLNMQCPQVLQLIMDSLRYWVLEMHVDGFRFDLASINFVTAQDGFTLHDLVAYNEKHNENNREDNNDGENNNLSWNCGAEGPTDDPEIRALRERQKRNLLATMLLSQGVPMISHGDELGRTQRGNNNAYCQDNEISWIDWNLDADKHTLFDFVWKLVQFRRAQPALRRRKYFQGRSIRGGEVKDVAW